MPKMLYILRTSPCAGNPHLQEFDNVLRSGLDTILNVQLSDVQWKQASLPVHMGRLGMRSEERELAGTFRLFGFSRGHAPTPRRNTPSASLRNIEDADVPTRWQYGIVWPSLLSPVKLLSTSSGHGILM